MSLYNLGLPDFVLKQLLDQSIKRSMEESKIIKFFGKKPYHFVKSTYKSNKMNGLTNYRPSYRGFGRFNASKKSIDNIYNKLEIWMKDIIKENKIIEFGLWRDKYGLEYKRERESYIFSVRIPKKLKKFERDSTDFPGEGDIIKITRNNKKIKIVVESISIATSRSATAIIITHELDK